MAAKMQCCDLSESCIDFSKIGVLNAANPTVVADILKPDSASVLRSDADAQLLISIPMTQPVKLHSLEIHAPPEAAPKTVKLFVNQPSLDFDDIDSHAPVQELKISAGSRMELQFVKFQNVSLLTVFVADNVEGEDEPSQLQQLQLFGIPIHSTNMNELKKMG